MNGPIVGAFQTTQINSPTSAFELINFANKTNVTINSGTPDQTIVVNNSTAATGLATLTVNSAGGSDQVTITATPPGVATAVNTFGNNDQVSVTGSGVPAGTTLRLDGGTGFDTLVYDAGGAPVTVTPGPGPGQVTITRTGSGSVVFQNFEDVTILNAVAAPPVPGAPVTFIAIEGRNLVDVVVATFTSGGTGSRAEDFGATINWGDGTTSAGVIVQDASDPTVFYVQGTHLYTNDGIFPTTTTLRALGGTTTTVIGGVPVTIQFGPSAPVLVGGTATVGDAPIVSQGTPVVGIEGSPLTAVLVATFQTIDLNATAADFNATITWGDGTTSAGTVTITGASPNGVTFRVTGTHTYADEGTYAVTVTVTSVGGSTATSGTTAFISDAPLQLVLFTPPLATAGTPLLGSAVLTFTSTDPNATADDFAAQFAPGDGTSSPAIVTQVGPGVFTVSLDHTFAIPGTYTGRVTVQSNGGSVLTVPITSQVVGLTATFPAISATEEVPLNDVVLATVASAGGPPINPSLYTATIDWGDGTVITPGFLDPATGNVRGSHTYQESGTYTVRIVVGTFNNPSLAVFTRTIAVADVPIILTGRLDPASDSGVSNSDGITFVQQPTFFGTSEDLSSITLSAQNTAGGAPIALGGTTADLNGNWQLTSQVALPDGQYVITATAVDRNGVTTASTVIATIVIDTIGPRVTAFGFTQNPGRLFVQFQDERSGLAQAPLTDGRNYQIEKPHLRPGRLLVRSLTATPPTGPTNPQTVTAVVTNRGSSNLGSGTFTVTVFNSPLGITDVAGNPLDGEFYGRFPSGNGVPGGDFVAIVDTIHNQIIAIRPDQAGNPIRIPNNPAAIPGVILPPTQAQLAAAQRQKRQEAQKARAEAAKAAAQARAEAARAAAQARAKAAKAAAQARAEAQHQAIVEARAAAQQKAAEREAARPTAQDLAREAAIRSMIGRAMWL